VTRLRTQAILLRAVDYGESDRIVHLLTPETGRLTAIAKGARRSVKRFPGTLDLFNHLRIEIDRRRRASLAYLEQATLLSPFLALRAVPARYALASYLIELLDRMAPEDGARPDTRRIFDFALSALRALQGLVPDSRLRILFELRALEALGLRPELRRCVRCGGDCEGAGTIDFHVADGGVVCETCAVRSEGLLSLQRGTLRVLEQAFGYELAQLPRLVLGPRSLAEAELLRFRFQRFHVGIELRSERFLNETLGGLPRGPA